MIEERIDLTLLIYFHNLLSIKIEESIKYLSTKIIVRLLYRFLILSIHFILRNYTCCNSPIYSEINAQTFLLKCEPS